MAEEYAVRLAKFPDRVSAIVGKTFAECGDDHTITDDDALSLIRDLILDLDPSLIERNKRKKLVRR